MEDKDFEALSAFMDGEHVDPDIFEKALGDPQATALLVKAVRLREALREQVTAPAAEDRARCRSAVRTEVARRSRRPLRFYIVAAAVAAVAGAGALGVEFGARYGPLLGAARGQARLSGPAEAAGVVAGAPTTVTVQKPDLPDDRPLGQPQPRRVLRFDPTRNWVEGGP
jgi:hypothetical protein